MDKNDDLGSPRLLLHWFPPIAANKLCRGEKWDKSVSRLLGAPFSFVVHGNVPEATITQPSWEKATVKIAGQTLDTQVDYMWTWQVEGSGEWWLWGVVSGSGICGFSQWQWLAYPPPQICCKVHVKWSVRKLFKNHNVICQCNLINNSSNKVVLRFGCLSRGHLKPEINYSLSGIRKDHTSSHFLLFFKSFFKFIF